MSPTQSTTYYATAAGCADSTFAYIHVDLDSLGGGGMPVSISRIEANDPSECGRCDGSIVLHGVAPHHIDSVFYMYNGVFNPVYTDSAASDSTITIRGLCAGAYTNIYLKVGTCMSNVVSANLTTVPLVSSFNLRTGLGCTNDTAFTVNTSTPAGFSSVWTFGDASPASTYPISVVHAYSAQGTYTIKHVYSNAYGCRDSSTQTVTFNHPLTSVFTASAYTVCKGDPITFTNTSVGNGATYRWDFGDGGSSILQNPTYNFAAAGEYAVVLTVTDTIHCTAKSVAKIEVISVIAKTDVVDTIVCLRNSMQLFGTATVTPSRFTNLVYNWSPATNLSDATVTNPFFFGIGDFTYDFTATLLPYGCSSTAREIIHSKPPLSLSHLTPSQSIVLGE
ncbi:MAG: PKD domain-containing protein, partial [Chitinophagia bacterium]|nr:PKD domain-containing protein [Chitinophagia bacterium]